MNVCILGSRTYQPLGDVDAALRALPPGATVTAFGSSPVCARAVLAATSLGLAARNVTLGGDRRELLAAAQSGAAVWLFVATDPATKQPTEGIAGIMRLLDAHGIPYRRIDAPLPARVCATVSRVQTAAERVRAARGEGRRRVALTRALSEARSLVALRDEFEDRLTDGMAIGVSDPVYDDRWLGWERAYRACCDGLAEVEDVLSTREVAA